MATKRAASVDTSAHSSGVGKDKYSDILKQKKLKLTDNMELLEDSVLRSDNLDEELKSSLAFDHIMCEYIILIERETEAKKTSISLSETEISNLVDKMPTALRVGKKYLTKKFPGTLDVPIELNTPHRLGEFHSILFVKENTFSGDKIVIDLRKCGKKEDGFIYTKQGIRISLNQASILQEKIKSYAKAIEENSNSTRQILRAAECFLLIGQINSMFNESVKNCEGCQIDDPSQKSHMGDSGCCREWADVVDEYWGAIKSSTTLPDVLKLAEKVAGEVNTILATSRASPVVDYSEEEKKKFVVDNKDVSRDKLLSICQKFHQ